MKMPRFYEILPHWTWRSSVPVRLFRKWQFSIETCWVASSAIFIEKPLSGEILPQINFWTLAGIYPQTQSDCNSAIRWLRGDPWENEIAYVVCFTSGIW
jgi:hypothetical protein